MDKKTIKCRDLSDDWVFIWDGDGKLIWDYHDPHWTQILEILGFDVQSLTDEKDWMLDDDALEKLAEKLRKDGPE